MVSYDSEECLVAGLIHVNIEMCLCCLKCYDVGTFDGAPSDYGKMNPPPLVPPYISKIRN